MSTYRSSNEDMARLANIEEDRLEAKASLMRKARKWAGVIERSEPTSSEHMLDLTRSMANLATVIERCGT